MGIVFLLMLMPTNVHCGEVDQIEPLGQNCPICGTQILRLLQGPRIYFACECIALEVPTVAINVCSDSWARDVLEAMRTRAEFFPPGAITGPVREG